MTKYVRVNNLGFRERKVIIISKSGAKIRDIKENVKTFYETNEDPDDVEKIIFSVGTNDITYSKLGVRHLKKHLVELVEMTKSLFPVAIILVQCCLPIRGMNSYIARNVLEFNSMLRDLSLIYSNCVYIDCFRDFLTRDRQFCNEKLYHDWLHLNKYGLQVLTTWLKFVINENSFDRVVDNLLGLRL